MDLAHLTANSLRHSSLSEMPLGDTKNSGQYYLYNNENQPIASTSTSYLRAPNSQNLKQRSPRPLSNLTGEVVRQNIYPDDCGGFADVYRALWKSRHVRSLAYSSMIYWRWHWQVAVKVLRSQSANEEDRKKRTKVNLSLQCLQLTLIWSRGCAERQRLRREIRVWQRLNHRHVLPLYGIINDFGPYPSMVCQCNQFFWPGEQ